MTAVDVRTGRTGSRGSWSMIGWAAFFGVLLAFARYWHSSQMGFYEDDYTLVTRAMASTWPQVREFVKSLLVSFGGQGRPLQHSLLYLLSWIAGQAGGLPQAYWLSWAILTLNTVLAYALLRRLFPPLAAIAGGLAYALYGADTTQAFLYHSFGLQQTLTYLLVALLLYVGGHKALSYVIILGSLLSYETAFPVFLAAPLLCSERGKNLAREWVRHAAILVTILVAVLALRIASGEPRIASLGFPELLTVPLVHMVQGPLVSLGTYFYRPIQVFQAFDLEMAGVLAIAFVALATALLTARGESRANLGELLGSLQRRSAAGLCDGNRRLLRLFGAGLLMVVLAYPLTFTIRAYALSGRDTRVHLAAVVGAAVIWACATELVGGSATTMRRQRAMKIVLAAYFALMVGFGFVVQRSYVRAWQLQRSFWPQVLRLCPDLSDGTVILVDPSGLEDPRFIYANHWNLPRVLEQVLVFPAEWEAPPRVFRLGAGWEDVLITSEGRFRLDSSSVLAPPSLYQEAEGRQVIFLETKDGALERVGGELEVNGKSLVIRGLPEGATPGYHRGFLYEYLVSREE
jgi:hypothetical protein